MKIVLFYHSLVSDWNHGNAHFLRGVATELVERGHEVVVFEPENGWSRQNLIAAHGEDPIAEFHRLYPRLRSILYSPSSVDLETSLGEADLVVVHEWNDHDLVREIGALRQRRDFVLLFHDTHHRLVTEPDAMRACDLTHYDGVLAFGDVLRDLYLKSGLAERCWTWHEAADPRVFHPHPRVVPDRDLVWIGNWGDGERSLELHEFLIEPVRQLGLKATVHGVRYPAHARAALGKAGIEYLGWLPNFRAPEVFARHRLTIHVPRRPYVETLPGIPTIRPFEALACGIPLISAPWVDCEDLFDAGEDYLLARDGAEMTSLLAELLNDGRQRLKLATRGLATIAERHTCAHRVDELLEIHQELRQPEMLTLFQRCPVAS